MADSDENKQIEAVPRALLITIAVVGAALIGAGWLGIADRIGAQREQENYRFALALDRAVRYLDQHVHHVLDEIESGLGIASYEYQERGSIDFAALIEAGAIRARDLVRLSIADPTGRLVATHFGEGRALGRDVSDREYFIDARDRTGDGFRIGRAIAEVSTGQPAIRVYRRLERKGRFLGVAVAAIRPELLVGARRPGEIGSDLTYAVVGQDGFVRAESRGQEVTSGHALPDHLRPPGRLRDATEGFFTVKGKGGAPDMAYAFRKVEVAPLLVIAGAPARLVGERTREAVRDLVAVGLGATVLALVFGAALVAALRRQYRALASAVGAAGEVERIRRRLHDAIEALDDGFVLLDAEDRFVVSNRKFRELYAHVADLCVPGTRYEDFIRAGVSRAHPDLGEEDRRVLIAERLARHIRYGERHEHRLGTGRWVRFTDTRTPGGDVVGLRADVTEQREAEENLAEALSRAEAANRAKGEFLSTISHEIRTPLNGILGMTAMLLESRLDGDQRAQAEIVKDCADRLLAVIGDILDFTTLEGGRIEFRTEPFDLGETTRLALGRIQASAADKGLVLEAQNGAAEGVWLGDAGRIGKVLAILLDNAVKFTERGRIILRARPSGGEGPGLRLEVEDSGVGIASADREALFQEFTQVDGSATRRHGGTGLGLALARRIVEGMGGRIGVESVVGRGSLFWLDLPLARGEAVSSGVRSLAGRRLLLVGLGAQGLARSLADAGANIVQATKGAPALGALRRAAAEKKPFDLALLDVELEDFQARDLLAMIRADARLAGLRLVFTRGGATPPPMPTRAGSPDAVIDLPAGEGEVVGTLAALLAEPVAKAKPASQSGLRVLIVDDSVFNREVALAMVKVLGHVASAVASGHEAVAAVAAGGVDVVLMDMNMPDIDGIAATKAIRGLPGAAGRIPVIAVTGNTDDEDRRRCLAAGMDGFLIKPIDREALAKNLGEIARSQPIAA